MKPKTFLLLILFLAAGVCTLQASCHNPGTTSAAGGFAVVELFTSEGCSSCPPADQAVARIERDDKDQPVYILAFHVDYWNRLGWKDMFSSADYTQRQGQYAKWLHLQSVYTPEVVVNGREEFVGSEEDHLRSVIKMDLQKTSSGQLTLAHVQKDSGQVNLSYSAGEVGKNSSLLIALIQKTAKTDVKRGENAGATLSHVQIVRSLRIIPLDGGTSGNTQLEVPTDLAGQDLEVIAFIQDNGTGQISAATKAVL